MKHWHRCSRWRERFEGCPFREIDHDDDEPDGEAEDILRLEKGGAAVPAKLPIAPIAVGARVRSEEPTIGNLVGARSIPIPVPLPLQLPVPVPVPLDLPGLPFPNPPGIDDVVRTIVQGIGQVPDRWRPSDAQLAEMTAKLGMSKGAARADVITAAAEVEAVSAFSVTAGIGLEDLWPVALIPLLKRLTKAKASARAGVVGRPGRMDPLRDPSTFKTGSEPHTNVRGLRPAPPPRTKRFSRRGGFGGLAVNMAARMRALTGQAPSRALGENN